MFKCLNYDLARYVVAARAPIHQCIQQNPAIMSCALARLSGKWWKTSILRCALLLQGQPQSVTVW